MNKQRYKIIILILSCVVAIESAVIISLLAKRKAVKKVQKAAVITPIKGKIAIVIDDWGYNTNNLRVLEQIKYPLTASVLPNLGYSRIAADELHRRGFEVILHLPMEPHEKYRLEKNTILVSFDEYAIANIIAQDLAGVPYVSGVSNHMGSRATEDPKAMAAVLKEIKKRNLFFLDSLVSSDSVCSDLAGKLQVKFIKRDIFLDNVEEAAYIKSQVYKLKRKAQAYGYAVGIGHDRKVTMQALKEIMPELAREGYKFVFVSELAKG